MARRVVSVAMVRVGAACRAAPSARTHGQRRSPVRASAARQAAPTSAGRRRTTPASARPRSRRWRRASAPPRRGAPPTAAAPSGPGRPPAGRRRSLRMHHARLRFSPSRWTSCGSVRSVTVAGSNSAFGSPFAAPGRNSANHVRNSAGGSTRRIRSASIRLGEKKSAPPGSHAAGTSASLREVGLRPLLDQLAQLLVADGPGVVVGEGQPERRVRVDAGADRVRLLREVLEVPARRSRPPAACRFSGPLSWRPGRPSRAAPRPA